jgi:hypothetical protein
MMRTLIIPIVMIAFVTQAHASAGVSCRAEDASVKFQLGAAFTRGLGGGMMNFGAELRILRAGVPEDLRAVTFEKSEASQVWYYGRDLKFQLYHERPGDAPFGYVNLVIEAMQRARDESVYRGRYKLRIGFLETKEGSEEKSLELRGRVTCSTE